MKKIEAKSSKLLISMTEEDKRLLETYSKEKNITIVKLMRVCFKTVLLQDKKKMSFQNAFLSAVNMDIDARKG